MPTHHDEQILPYTPEQLFALVKDIEKYPEFLPWCRAARITKREVNGDMLAELVISFKHLTEQYVSRVKCNEGGAKTPWGIDVVMVSGPFHHLTNHWEFHPHADGCRLVFGLDFKFRSSLLEMLIGGMFAKAAGKMSAAFRERAQALYGSK